MTTRHGVFFTFDGWLMFDSLQYTCLSDVTSNMWQLLLVEVQNVYGDYSEIRDSRVQPVTRFSMQHATYDFEFDLSGQLNLAITGSMLLMFMTIHLFQLRFADTEQYFLRHQPLLIG